MLPRDFSRRYAGMVREKYGTARIIALFACVLVYALASSERAVVTDEKLRQASLRAMFPQTNVSVERRKRMADSPQKKSTNSNRPTYPDALSGEAIYLVRGPARNKVERCASENLEVGTFSSDRQVRLKVFRWPGTAGTELLVLTQYKFDKANPAGSCWSIGMLVHLVLNNGAWHHRETHLLNPQHHSSIQRVELIDLTGTGFPELVVESDSGGAGMVSSSLQVFNLGDGKFNEVLNTQSRMEAGMEAGYTQELDVSATRAERGKRFRVTKTAYFENGVWLSKPRISHEFYERASGGERYSTDHQHLLDLLK